MRMGLPQAGHSRRVPTSVRSCCGWGRACLRAIITSWPHVTPNPQQTANLAVPEKKSEPLWIWKAWDRATGQLVDWECGDRDRATCERLIERLTRWRTRLYCADDYAVYDVLLPVGQLYAGKAETHGI